MTQKRLHNETSPNLHPTSPHTPISLHAHGLQMGGIFDSVDKRQAGEM